MVRCPRRHIGRPGSQLISGPLGRTFAQAMREHTATDIHELIRAADTIREQLPNEPWWRGQADQHWELVAGVFRRQGGWNYEQAMVRRFIQGAATRHPSLPPLNERARWLFLMQHYRLPTRLLDWTESILVAAFFAVWEHPHRTGAVYALDPIGLTRACIRREAVQPPTEQEAALIVDMAFEASGGWDDLAIAVQADEIDTRMLVQRSTFTLHGGATPMIKLKDADTYLQSIIIPFDAKPSIRTSLKHLGIRQSTLFPDLTNLAADLAHADYPIPR